MSLEAPARRVALRVLAARIPEHRRPLDGPADPGLHGLALSESMGSESI